MDRGVTIIGFNGCPPLSVGEKSTEPIFIFCLVGRSRLNEVHKKEEFFLSLLQISVSVKQRVDVLPHDRE